MKKTPSTDPKFDELCTRLQTEMKRLKIPGAAIGILHEGQEFYAGFGKTSLENPLPVTPDTLFQVGSISKTFTATLLMQLMEAGKLKLDSPVRKILPKFKMSDKEVEKSLTTRHLLTHTGGWIGDYFNDFGNGDDALKLMVKSIRKLPQITPLGTTWSYNNAGFNIAARIVEVLTGQPYETAAQQMLLTPLGLQMTFFYPSDILITHRFVVGHQTDQGKVKVTRPWAIGRAGNGVGGVVSTVQDLIKYAQFHMGQDDSTLSRASLDEMKTIQVQAGGFNKMGISWFIRQADDLTIYGHGGATHGQQAGFHFIPQKEFALAILTNADEGGTLTDKALKWALELYFQSSLPNPEPIEIPAAELDEYAALYELPLSAIDIRVEDNQLVLQDIPRGGFPTPETPPGPAMPAMRAKFFAKDRIVILDGPSQGAIGEFLRNDAGKIAFLRIGGRIHVWQAPD